MSQYDSGWLDGSPENTLNQKAQAKCTVVLETVGCGKTRDLGHFAWCAFLGVIAMMSNDLSTGRSASGFEWTKIWGGGDVQVADDLMIWWFDWLHLDWIELNWMDRSGWLVGWLVDWSIDWLIDWWMDGLIDWLIPWLTGAGAPLV